MTGGGQKGGAGRGGRESNTKKTKNKYRDRGRDDEDDESYADVGGGQKKKNSELPFLSVNEVRQ
jgi:hypothetical protein